MNINIITIIPCFIILPPILLWSFCHSLCDCNNNTNESNTDSVKRWIIHDLEWFLI